jgi:hypothetical protein
MSLNKHHHFMWGFSKSLVSILKRPVFIYLSTLSLTLILLFSFVFHMVEGQGINPKVNEFFDSLYFCVTITTGVGLGDIAPVTRFGKILTIAMMFLGTGIFVSFTGTLAASILEVELQHTRSKGEGSP